ncbi:MAG TPA: choline/ethanolamine kinase family protein [Dongiaceae bacterium]|jgi:thiamine kinase-like enzyme|nr:choline/ethanolamine kinase family protein [Dongiaceae bacterium]
MIRNRSWTELLTTIPILSARPAAEWRATPLPGLTNVNWRLTAGDQDLVLRIPGASSERYLSRRQEMHNAAIAAALGVAPPLLHADPATGVTVQAFIGDARALGEADFAEPRIAFEIGTLLARLHRSGRSFEGTMAPFPIIDTYLGLAADDRLRRLRARAEPIRAVLEAHPLRMVPSHVDPNPANFLLRADGTLLLIDWEFSAMCEPAWDLAAVMIEGVMPPEAVDALHRGYGRPPDAADASRLWLMRAALHLVAGSWTYAEIAGGNQAAGLPALLERCLTNLERMLDDRALTLHLSRAGARSG